MAAFGRRISFQRLQIKITSKASRRDRRRLKSWGAQRVTQHHTMAPPYQHGLACRSGQQAREKISLKLASTPNRIDWDWSEASSHRPTITPTYHTTPHVSADACRIERRRDVSAACKHVRCVRTPQLHAAVYGDGWDSFHSKSRSKTFRSKWCGTHCSLPLLPPNQKT